VALCRAIELISNTTAARASEATLGKLHEAVAKQLLDKVQSGEASVAEINAAIKLLKDNNIVSLVETGDTMSKLYHALPEFDENDK